MSVFSTWLRAEMQANGWDQRSAARAFGVRETTVHNWLHQNMRPSNRNLLRIALATRKPIDAVARAAGFDDFAAVLTDDAAASERARLLAALPQFAEIIDVMARKSLDEQAVYIALIRQILLGESAGSRSR